MSKYTKYKLYQKYETRGSQEAIPCYPNVFSIDGDGTMPLVIVEENSRDCGYTGETQPIYRWYTLPIDTYYYCDACQDAQYKWVNLPIAEDWECVGTTKYYKQKKMVSVDGGSTWTDVTPPQYQRGALYEQDSSSCGYRTRTTSGTPYCTGYDKYVDVYSQYSTDGGNTWQTTATTPTMVERNSRDCGYVPDPQYRTTSGTPYCSGYDKYVDVYSQVSYDEGATWETTATTPTMIEHNSTDCGYEIKYRTISGDPYCEGYDKYIPVYSQVSYDMGITWETTATTPTMIEHNSYDCGYIGYRWTRTNSTLCINTAHTEVDYVQTPSVSPYAGIELLNIPSSTNTPMYYEIDFSVETISEGEARPLAQKSDNETVGYQMGFCLADNEWLTKPFFDYGGGRIETTYQDIGGIGNRLKVGVGVYSGDSQVEIRRLDTNTRLVSSAATPTNVLIPVICNATYNTNTSGDTYASSNQIRYYGIKVYDNNVLVGNYIPVIRNSDNLVTLFDTITNRYCNIIGSGQLTASPNV